MKIADMKNALLAGELNARLTEVYGADAVAAQQARYANALDEFAALYGADRDVSLLSVSGRSELSGNHTDHNYGCVVAAAIDLDIIAVASANSESEEILKAAQRRALLKEEEILREADEKAARTLARAEEQIELEKKRAIKVLYPHMLSTIEHEVKALFK